MPVNPKNTDSDTAVKKSLASSPSTTHGVEVAEMGGIQCSRSEQDGEFGSVR